MEAAKSAAKGVEELQDPDSDSESFGEGGTHSVTNLEGNNEEENDMDFSRKSALDKLENASEDSLFGQVCLHYLYVYFCDLVSTCWFNV